VELKYILEADRLTRICHHLLQDPLNLDATQTLPKTNSIPSIINNDQRIQVRHFNIDNHRLLIQKKFCKLSEYFDRN